MTRITKRLRLPSVTAYLTAGILIGPCCLNLIPQPMIEKTDFLADLALCFIAFSAGEFFKLETLQQKRLEGGLGHHGRCLCRFAGGIRGHPVPAGAEPALLRGAGCPRQRHRPRPPP